MDDKRAEGLAIFALFATMVIVGCFFIFTIKSCVIETENLNNEKLRIERNCPEQKK
jgi:hypothetical protein